jgi:hypothetical protein
MGRTRGFWREMTESPVNFPVIGNFGAFRSLVHGSSSRFLELQPSAPKVLQIGNLLTIVSAHTHPVRLADWLLRACHVLSQ